MMFDIFTYYMVFISDATCTYEIALKVTVCVLFLGIIVVVALYVHRGECYL